MRTLLFSIVLILFQNVLHAQQVTQVYDTYLPANKLIPILEPLLNQDDKITGYHNKLFVKASPATQDELLRLLQDLDRPLKNIQISLRYSADEELETQHAGGTVKVYRGSSRSHEIDVEVVNKNRMSTHVDNADSQIRVLEGEQGVLDVGKEIPIEQLVLLGPWQAGINQQYKSVSNQLYVIPKLVKDKIRVELFTSNQRLRQGKQEAIEKMDAETVLLLEPGEWSSLAGNTNARSRSSNGTTLSTRHEAQGQKTLQIRADILE